MIPAPATALLVSALVSAILHLVADYRGATRVAYVFKPLTIALLIGFVAVVPHPDRLYAVFIVAGLALSLAGDVFLMLPRDRFIAGLLSFLAAHVAYILALSRGVPFGARPLLLVPFIAAALLVLRILWPRLGKLRLPVVVYVAVLVGMAGQAAGRAAVIQTAPASAAAVGAALFVISDAVLAINRFRRTFRAAQAVVMSTYVSAQALIALSVV